MRCPHFLVFSDFCFPSPFFLFLGEHSSLLNILPSPLFYIWVLSFLPYLWFLWVVVFSLVIMTEPYASHDASKIELLITNGMLFLQKGLWSFIRLTSFPNTCFSTCLVMSIAVQLVSDFVFTPYVLRQLHGIKVTPPSVICMILMISKMSSMFFSTAPIPTWFLSAGNMHLCFPKQKLMTCLLFKPGQ